VAANVADLIAATTMTDRGRRLFLASAPAVEDQATFARNCGIDAPAGAAAEARVHTQGCYVSGRIHLLAGDRVEARELLSVVAAHELLHAAYASLGPAERTRIDAELDAARAGNDRLEERLRAYGTGPTIGNEIHSILGTEFAGLSPVLEAHYAQFFGDRARLVATRQRTLGSREEQIRSLKAGIDALDTRITSLKDALDGMRATGDIRRYNANVVVINGLVSQYEADVADLNARIDEYNLLLGG